MKQFNKLLTFLLAIAFCFYTVPAQATSVALFADESQNLYTEGVTQTINIQGINYSFYCHIINGNRAITITNDSNDDVETVVQGASLPAVVMYNQTRSFPTEEGWVVLSSDSHYISWAEGASVAAIAAAIAVGLGYLGPVGVIAAIGPAVISALAGVSIGGTVYLEIQKLDVPFVNQTRIVWNFTASTGEYFGPFFDYITI